MKTILLAGKSGVGKTTFANFLGAPVLSTSELLRTKAHSESVGMTGVWDDEKLGQYGRLLDDAFDPWLVNRVQDGMVVDAVRSGRQVEMILQKIGHDNVVLVNVVCDEEDRKNRLQGRWGRDRGVSSLAFEKQDQFQMLLAPFTWDSSRMPIAQAAAIVRRLAGFGFADVVIGGQYGSEGKGKLCALLAPDYTDLVRSGGPNAGHWVREDRVAAPWEFCFHQIPSGAKSNPLAQLHLAAGASLNWTKLTAEMVSLDCQGRTWVDRNAVFITDEDIEREKALVGAIGSTGQGVGQAQIRRLLRNEELQTAFDVSLSGEWGIQKTDVAAHLSNIMRVGGHVMLEGTQGSGLSIYHGPYPYVTSRDTNVSGLLSEVGMPPSWVRDTWMVIRSYPIRVGGNSGPMKGELNWRDIAENAQVEEGLLKSRELTSTTHRLRRVGMFDVQQFIQACRLNNPTKLFLTFADYLDPHIKGVARWADVPKTVSRFVESVEGLSGVPVVGISTGRLNSEVVWRPGFER